MQEARVLIIYIVAANIVAFLAFGADKMLARSRRRRISEATLLALAAVGGSIGAWLGMYLFRHKTLHRKFSLGIPLIIAAHVGLFLLCSCKSHRVVELPPRTCKSERAEEFSPSTLLILYDAETGKAPLLKAVREYGATVIYDYRMMNGMAIRKPDDRTIEESIDFFRKVKGVVSVERDRIIRLTDPVRPRLEVM